MGFMCLYVYAFRRYIVDLGTRGLIGFGQMAKNVETQHFNNLGWHIDMGTVSALEKILVNGD
jgi:hypothetical protein